MNTLRDIRDFHRKFQQFYDGPPRVLDGELAHFRIGFLLEEVKELAEMFGLKVEYSVTDGPPAVGSLLNKLNLALDALVDLDYVQKGTVHLMGLDACYHPAWGFVHGANMGKVLAGNADLSKRGYALDVIKPDGWSPPDHRPLLRNLIIEEGSTHG